MADPEAPFQVVTPFDSHNRALVSYTHPLDRQNPPAEGRYNLVAIGGGTAGLVAAGVGGAIGAKTALIERKLLGGDCLVTGCVPSKALVASARAAHDARTAATLGVNVGDVSVDFSAVMERLRARRADIAPHDSVGRIEGEFNVDVFLGDARFTGRGTIEVTGEHGPRTIHFKKAVIATGSKPRVPDLPGLAEAGYLTNETLFSLTDLPRRLCVIGGGPIGCEMAQAFARLGSEVTLLQTGGRVLEKDDADLAEIVREQMEAEGVRFRFDATAERVESNRDGKTIIVGGERIDCDQILVAAGRSFDFAGLGLDAAGVQFDDRGIESNDFLQTTNPNVYVAGDAAGRLQFTHAADAMGRIVARNALLFGRRKASKLVVPWCTYTDPELATVGDCSGRDARTIDLPMKDNDRSIVEDDTRGRMKVFHRGKRIVGVTICCRNAGDLIGEASLAITNGVGLNELAETIHPYPTVAELFRSAGDEYTRGMLTAAVMKALRALHRWRR